MGSQQQRPGCVLRYTYVYFCEADEYRKGIREDTTVGSLPKEPLDLAWYDFLINAAFQR